MRRDRDEPARRGRRGTWSSPTRPSTSRTPRSSTARALRTDRRRAPGSRSPAPRWRTTSPSSGRSSTGRPRACSAAAHAFRKVWAAPIECGRRPDQGAAVRRPDRAVPAAPPQVRPRHRARAAAPRPRPTTRSALTREQVVLYEAFVRDTMDRIERRRRATTRRGLVLTLLTGLKQICNHPAHFLKESGARASPAARRSSTCSTSCSAPILAEDGAALVFTQYVAMARLLEAHLARAGVPHQFLHGGTPVREREAMVRALPGRRAAAACFLLSLKAGGTGLEPHPRRPRRPLRPLVEPGGRGAGHRPRLPDRPDPAGAGAPADHRGHHRGADRRAAARASARWPTRCSARGEAALTELSDDELRDLVTPAPEDGPRAGGR